MNLGPAEMMDFGLGEYITQKPSNRYPIYTRGNAGEVWPEVAYPLTITLTNYAGVEATARAAIKAGEIANHAEFFSFGTNDLTQTTFGISRDDSGKFLNDYIENKIFSIDPFVSIDEGVEDLVEIAVIKGKKVNKKIKLGICGEHGGDPKSINFCSKIGLNYVSCSPYRVPIARLAAAQAEIKK